MAFGCLVHSASSSLAVDLSEGICASMCPCFHHFLLFSAKKKWDCASGGFCSFSGFVTHAGPQQRETAVLGTEDLAKQAGTSQSAAGCTGCCAWDLRFLSGCPATSKLGEGWGRFTCKPGEAEKRLLLLRLVVSIVCEVTNFDEPKETELKFCQTWGLDSSPFLSFPAIHSLSYLTWDPIDTHILWDWYSYSCRTVTFRVADSMVMNAYYILVVWDLP